MVTAQPCSQFAGLQRTAGCVAVIGNDGLISTVLGFLDKVPS